MKMFLYLLILATFSCAHDGEFVPSMTVRSADTVLPLGAVIAWWSKDDVPEGWLECDGQAIPEGEPLRELMTHTPNYINRFIGYTDFRPGDNFENVMGLNSGTIFSAYRHEEFRWFNPTRINNNAIGNSHYYNNNSHKKLFPIRFISPLNTNVNLSLHEYDINGKSDYSNHESRSFIQTNVTFNNGLYKYKIVIPYFLKKYTEQDKIKLSQGELIPVAEEAMTFGQIKYPDMQENKKMLKAKIHITSTFSSHDQPVVVDKSNLIYNDYGNSFVFQNHYSDKVKPRNVYVRYIIKNF